MKSFLRCTLLGTFLALFLTGCTVYRSEGRKQFESEAAGKLSSSSNFQLMSCKNETRLETWLNDEFPSVTYEMVVMENDLEVWRTLRGSVVEIKAIQRSEKKTHSCIYHFANDIVWNLYKSQFIKELENNLMTLE